MKTGTVSDVVRSIGVAFPIAKGAEHVVKMAEVPLWGAAKAKEAADLLTELTRAVAAERGVSMADADAIVAKSREGRALRAVHDAIYGHQGAQEWGMWADHSPSVTDL